MERLDELEARFLEAQADADWLIPLARPAELAVSLHVRAVLETCRRELREVKELAASRSWN